MVDSFVALLGPEGVLTEDLDRYEEGWRYGRGRARFVLRPSTTAQVSAALALCARQGLVVVPQGANTGLVGASVPDPSGDQVVLSLERLAGTLEIDPVDRVAVVDGGVVLSRLDAAAGEHGLWFPVDLGADPQVGAMVATNAGGTRLLKYGDVRHNLLGLEVVLADGTVLDALSRVRKDNTGLDVKQLFTGTFGALGVVTRAILTLAPRPRQRAAALVALSRGETALALLRALEQEVHGLLCAFEVMSAAAIAPALAHLDVRDPWRGAGPAPLSALVELDTPLDPATLDLDAVLAETLARAVDGLDGVEEVFVGGGEDLWALRHGIPEGLCAAGPVLGLDVSVPRSRLASFRQGMVAWLAAHHPWVTLRDFGHWGDGGVHLNLTWEPASAPADAKVRARAIQAHVYEVVRDHGGSWSAEHGVGPHNADAWRRFTSPLNRRLLDALAGITGRLGRGPL